MKIFEEIKRFIFPNNCQICGLLIETKPYACVCENCWKKIKIIPVPRCIKCARNIPGISIKEKVCPECARKKFYYDEIVAAAYFEDEMKEIIHCFKYKSRWQLKKYLSDLVLKNIDESFWDIDYLIPVPLHYTRIKKRGYNQSEEIAKEISKKRGLPVLKNLLLRTRETTPQSTLQKEARLLNIKNAFGINKFSNYRKLAGKKFVVVDDVFTTGSTINECAKVLHALEPSSIKAVTVARGA